MIIFLIVAFLFSVGSMIGWTLELFYRRFISSANPERKWINPGFLVGPCLPLYGCSLVAMFLLSYIPVNFVSELWMKKLILFILMGIVITVIEYFAGLIFIKGMNVKLWDYDNEWGNIKGIICPKYTFFWMLLSAFYYFCIHPRILKSLYWLAENLAFSFFIGMFYGVFIIDLCYSFRILSKIRAYAAENDIKVRIEELKRHARIINEREVHKGHFILALKTDKHTLAELVKEYSKREAARLENIKEAIENTAEKLDDMKEEISDYFANKKNR